MRLSVVCDEMSSAAAAEARRERERERSRQRYAAKAVAEGRTIRSYVRGSPTATAEHKRMGRLCAWPGYEPVKQDAHVRAWTSAVKESERERAMADRMTCVVHQAHVSLWKKERNAEWFRHQYHTNPEFNAYHKMKSRLRKKTRLDGEIAAYMVRKLKRGVFANGWEQRLGYTAAQLIAHLKRTVPKGRRWDDFLQGRLHIDHITPCAAFDLTREDEVRACWSLGNLRLLDGRENLKKRANREFLL